MFGMQRRNDRSIGAVMRGAVGADQSAAVEREHDRQVLQRDVVDQLVVGALQERRVDRDHRPHAVAGKPGRKGDRVLLGDADIEVAVRELLLEAHQPRAFAHRRRDADHARIGRGRINQPVAEDLRVAGLAGGSLGDADMRVELARTVVQHRIGFGELVTLALARDDVQELRTLCSAFMFCNVGISESRSWPSIGPM